MNFLNAVKGSDVDDNEGGKTLGNNPVCNLHFAPPTTTDGRVTVAGGAKCRLRTGLIPRVLLPSLSSTSEPFKAFKKIQFGSKF